MTDFCKNIFGKSLNELTLGDFQHYFEIEREESDILEFKSFDPEHSTINQDIRIIKRAICAFLNSSGGVLIWGAASETQIDGRKVCQGDLKLVREKREKDQIMSSVSDSIAPLPVNINVQIIESDSEFLYVFEIQQSNYSPHQFDNKYWARLDGQTKPAPHYLIDALFNRVRYPNIEGFINLDFCDSLHDGNWILKFSILICNFTPLINEYDIIYRVTCPQAVFEFHNDPNLGQNYTNAGHTFVNKGNIGILHYGANEMTQQAVIYNFHQLVSEGKNHLDILLSFGGKNSPLKTSRYRAVFKSPVSKDDPRDMLEVVEENVLAIDKVNELGSSREKLLSEILKR